LPPAAKPPLCLGRYELLGELAAGGMATVHYGRLLGPVGFSRAVAIKRMSVAGLLATMEARGERTPLSIVLSGGRIRGRPTMRS
jgi:hypothetical protein